ncbi:MAG TPA: hypothetical protein VIY49_04420 [Bryobacteraceae bacterium]
MEYACTTGDKDLEEHHLQPGALDGSGRDGSAIATPCARCAVRANAGIEA